jgi:hypothetical protein
MYFIYRLYSANSCAGSFASRLESNRRVPLIHVEFETHYWPIRDRGVKFYFPPRQSEANAPSRSRSPTVGTYRVTKADIVTVARAVIVGSE